MDRQVIPVDASVWIESGLPLLYSDRDFDPFVEHLGLRPASADFSGKPWVAPDFQLPGETK